MISASNIEKAYRTPVIDGADCTFHPGEVTFLMGANGAGKTTFFKCLLELEHHGGAFDFGGEPLASVRHQVFAVFDDSPVYPLLNGYANVELLVGRRVTRTELDEAWRLGGAPTSLGLLRKQARTYSSGERKRLHLAAAVLCRPSYLILDEIASGLDIETMDAAVRAIRELTPGTVVIASGHQFDFYSRIVNRVVLLRYGRMKEVRRDDEGRPLSLEALYRTHIARSN